MFFDFEIIRSRSHYYKRTILRESFVIMIQRIRIQSGYKSILVLVTFSTSVDAICLPFVQNMLQGCDLFRNSVSAGVFFFLYFFSHTINVCFHGKTRSIAQEVSLMPVFLRVSSHLQSVLRGGLLL